MATDTLLLVAVPCRWEKWGEDYGRMYWQQRGPLRRTCRRVGKRGWLVDIFGVQFDEGRIERNVTAQVDDEPITAAEARQLACALLEAGDELDRLGNRTA